MCNPRAIQELIEMIGQMDPEERLKLENGWGQEDLEDKTEVEP